jgi:hypothetical protein
MEEAAQGKTFLTNRRQGLSTLPELEMGLNA